LAHGSHEPRSPQKLKAALKAEPYKGGVLTSEAEGRSVLKAEALAGAC
jgi:hypothetical protein